MKKPTSCPGYSVDESGKITVDDPVVPVRWTNGYPFVVLNVPGGKIAKSVTEIVAEAFHGPRPTPLHRAVRLGDQADLSAANIAWKSLADTRAEKAAATADRKEKAAAERSAATAKRREEKRAENDRLNREAVPLLTREQTNAIIAAANKHSRNLGDVAKETGEPLEIVSLVLGGGKYRYE